MSLSPNFYKFILLPFFAAFLLNVSVAQTPRSVIASGDWNDPSIWSPLGVPGIDDDATIPSGFNVTASANATCRRIYVSGTLDMSGASGITLEITNHNVVSATNGLQLNAGGSLKIGANNILYFSNSQSSGIVNNGGSIVSSGTSGADGGTIKINSCCGWEFRVSGTVSTTVYNFYFIQNAFMNIESGGLLVNGTLTVIDNNFTCSSSVMSPVYGPASTLYIGNNGQSMHGCACPLNSRFSQLWTVSSGTIGVTPGYPNNVTLVNMSTNAGTLLFTSLGWRPGATDIGLNGILRIGDGTGGAPGSNPTGSLNGSLDQVTSFSCGGIIVDNGSTLIGPSSSSSFVVKGNFTLQGATTGVFLDDGAVIDFQGSGTFASPNTISTTGAAAISFSGIKVTSGYVQLQDPVSVGTLNLAGGIIGTTSTNILTVTNTANTAISGGSSSSFVDGPLSWNFPASTLGTYTFPVGDYSKGPAYLPLSLTSANSSSGTTLTVQGINSDPGGTKGDLAISSMSTTEYWSVSYSNLLTSGAYVDVVRPTAISPYNTLAKSATASGAYILIGGSPSSATKISGGGLNTTPAFLRMVNSNLAVVSTVGSSDGLSSSCASTSSGSLVVSGVGGTLPYTYSVAGYNGGAFQSSNTFSPLAAGSYSVTVKDNTGATKTVTLNVLTPISINGNNKDVDICAGQSTTLVASNISNGLPTYSWSPGGETTSSITVSPATTTTYTVTSLVYVNNLLPDGDFESGMPSAYVAGVGYSSPASSPYPSTPGNGGYYLVSTAGNQLCSPFTSLAAQSGNNYYVADGYIDNTLTTVFQLNITGLTINTTYRLSFWYAQGTNNPRPPQVDIGVTGGTVTAGPGTLTVTNYTSWLEASYDIQVTSTSITLSIINPANYGTTDGNDLYIDNMQFLSPCEVSSSIKVTANCTLPVDVAYFDVVKQTEEVLLTWATTLEKNSSVFVIEKSKDGNSFIEIGKVNASSNSKLLKNYSFVDPALSPGTTYYRLAEYDINGTIHYSQIKTIYNDDGINVKISPNPNNGNFLLIFEMNSVNVPVTILNYLGQVVYEKIVYEMVNKIDISDFPSSVYYLQIVTNDGKIIKKVIRE